MARAQAYEFRSHDAPRDEPVAYSIAGTIVKKPFYKILYVQVIAAIIIGIVLGHFSPAFAVDMKPLLTGSYGLDDVQTAFELAGDRSRSMKVQLSF